MRQSILSVLVFSLCVLVLVPVSANAQARRGQVPHTGQSALGLDVGGFVPSGGGVDQLDGAPVITGFFEYYFTPRVSVRPSVGFTQPDLKGSTIDEVRMIPMRFDVDYNWEGGKWHPFVGAGLGAYYMQYRRRGASLGDAQTNLGGNLGGGIEYFFNRRFVFKGEVRYQAIGDVGRIDPSGTAITAGFKRYF